MLPERLPWGLGGGMFVCLFVRSFVNVRGRRCFQLGVGGRCWIPCRIREDYTGLDRST